MHVYWVSMDISVKFPCYLINDILDRIRLQDNGLQHTGFTWIEALVEHGGVALECISYVT